MSDIFISYSREDLERVKVLAEALENQGWDVWWDRRIPPGKTWREVISQALSEARCAVVVWSSSSIESPWVLEEADHARERGIPLLPTRIESVKPPLGFRSLQLADLMGWNGETSAPGFQTLADGLSAALGAAPKTLPEGDQESGRYPASEPPRSRAQMSNLSKWIWLVGGVLLGLWPAGLEILGINSSDDPFLVNPMIIAGGVILLAWNRPIDALAALGFGVTPFVLNFFAMSLWHNRAMDYYLAGSGELIVGLVALVAGLALVGIICHRHTSGSS